MRCFSVTASIQAYTFGLWPKKADPEQQRRKVLDPPNTRVFFSELQGRVDINTYVQNSERTGRRQMPVKRRAAAAFNDIMWLSN